MCLCICFVHKHIDYGKVMYGTYTNITPRARYIRQLLLYMRTLRECFHENLHHENYLLVSRYSISSFVSEEMYGTEKLSRAAEITALTLVVVGCTGQGQVHAS